MDGTEHTGTNNSPRAAEPGLDAPVLRDILVELAAVAADLIAEADAADATMERLSDACEAQFEARVTNGIPHGHPAPNRAGTSIRSTLANRIARERRDAAREFAAWWADVATLALAAAGTGGSVPPARVAAADPTIALGAEDLRYLPEIPAEDRDLALLAAGMAMAPAPHGERAEDMAAVAREQATRVGMSISYANGTPAVFEDGFAEARRRRLWGELWIDARVPALPNPDQLTAWLTQCGAATPMITDITDAAHAIVTAAAARLRAQELERDDSADGPDEIAEIEALWDQADQLTALLAAYSRKITDVLSASTGDGERD